MLDIDIDIDKYHATDHSTRARKQLSSVTARLLGYGWGAALLALADLRARWSPLVGWLLLLLCNFVYTIQFLPVCCSLCRRHFSSLSRHGRKRPEERGRTDEPVASSSAEGT